MRVKHSEETGNLLANYLKEHPAVEDVIHVGAEWFPQRELFLKQMRGSVSLMTFIPKCQDGVRVKEIVKNLNLFHVGVSWGGFESLAVANEIQASDWDSPKWTIRIYAGLEDPEDLMADLDQALRKSL